MKTPKYEYDDTGRWKPDSANAHIRTALLSAPATKDGKVTGIGTTNTGYLDPV